MPRRLERLRSEARLSSRTPSDLLADLHVYILPQDKWIPFRRLARNTVSEETVSAGFVRVLPDVNLVDLRQELAGQLGVDVPEHYVFIKCVGRNFTQVKPHQEQMVKVKNFLPPHADEPEIHIMEIGEDLMRYAPSLSNLLVSDTELSESHGPSRLTQRESYARSENLGSWAEANEGKWEELREGEWEELRDAHHRQWEERQLYEGTAGAAASAAGSGILVRDHYNLDSGVVTHWRTTEEGDREEVRHRGDGMSEIRERRSVERDEGEGGSTESSEEQGKKSVRRSRRSEGRSRRSEGRGGRTVGRGGRSQSRGGRSKGKGTRGGANVRRKVGEKSVDEEGQRNDKHDASENGEKDNEEEDRRIVEEKFESSVTTQKLLNAEVVERIEEEGYDGENESGGQTDRKALDESKDRTNENETHVDEEDGFREKIRQQLETGEEAELDDDAEKRDEKVDENEENENMETKAVVREEEVNVVKIEQLHEAENREDLDETAQQLGSTEDSSKEMDADRQGDSHDVDNAESAQGDVTNNSALDEKENNNASDRENNSSDERGNDNADEREISNSDEKENNNLNEQKNISDGTENYNLNESENILNERENDVGEKEINLDKSENVTDNNEANSSDRETHTDEKETNSSERESNLDGVENSNYVDGEDNNNSNSNNESRDGRSEADGSEDFTNVGRNIYAKAENGDMVRLTLTGDTETGDQEITEKGGEKDGEDPRNNDGKTKDSSDGSNKQEKRKHDASKKAESTRLTMDTRRSRTKIQGGGWSQGEVGGTRQGRARLRRRLTKGSSVTAVEGDEERFGGSLVRRGSRSTRYESTGRLTRSISASRVEEVGSYAETLAGDGNGRGEGPKVKRSASEERLGYDPWLYAPHKWYYARIERPLTGEEAADITSSGDIEDRKARLKALEAKKQASLDEANNDDVPRPNVEILSMEDSLRGPLSSLPEDVSSGLQVNSNEVDGTTESPQSLQTDRLTLTYEIEVDENGGRIRKIKEIGGKGAWESEVEDGSNGQVGDSRNGLIGDSSNGLVGDADGEDTTGVTDSSESTRKGKKGRKATRGKANEPLSQEKISNRLAQVLKEKQEAEEQRQKLFKQAKDLHDEILRIKEKRRETWWKKYNEARKIGGQLEEQQASYRSELDSLHRKIIGSIIRRQPLVTGVRDEPSRKANYKISIIRLRHEVEDLRRRVEAMDIKVETEVRLRNQAEREVKTLREEVSRKKANMALSQTKASMLRNSSSFPTDLAVRM